MNIDEAKLHKMLASPATRHAAFSMVVRQYSEMLYWKIRHFVLYHDDADDVLQNVFLKAWSNLDSFKGESKISTWLYTIAVNESLGFLRRRQSQIDADASLYTARHLLADEYFDGNQAEALLQEAIARLPEMQRTVFVMRYFEEMKYSEICKILNRSEGAMKANYHIAMNKISEYIKKKN